MSILVVGTVALDTVQTPVGGAKDVLGGSATYFAVSASFFNQVRLVGIIGTDFPQRFINFLQAKKIDTGGLQKQRGRTFRWVGRYSLDLHNPHTLSTELNLLRRFQPELPSNYRQAKFIFLANISPRIQLQVLTQLRCPRLIVADTMNYWIAHERGLLTKVIKRSDILLLNEAEARQFTGEFNLIRAAKALLSLGPHLVIIKRGECGCLLFARTFTFYLPAYLQERILDPTGAGDTFAGGFLGFLSSCSRITPLTCKEAALYGTIMASYVVEDFSLHRLRNLKKREITDRCRRFQRMIRL